jgi:hypothetical protein
MGRVRPRCDAALAEDVPFADHNAILDPTCSDLTGRVLELLGYIGYDRETREVQRALRFVRETQEADGSWYGRWGVNYIYGTWQVLRGLRSIGEDMRQPWIVRAQEWLESCQNDDGGWGETCASYDDRTEGQGESTPSQTAWALMGLLAGPIQPTRQAATRARSPRHRFPRHSTIRRRLLARAAHDRHRFPRKYSTCATTCIGTTGRYLPWRLQELPRSRFHAPSWYRS